MDRFDSDEILDLVGNIYDVALSADGWEPVLARMTALFEGTATVFFVRDRHAVETTFFRTWGFSEAALREAVDRLSTLDVGLDALLTLPSGSIMTESAAPESHRTSEVLQEYLRRWDIERFVGGDVFRDERRFGVVSVLGSGRRAPFGAAETELLQTLIPHLRRAVELRSRFDLEDRSRSIAQEVIEGMLTGVVLLDDAGAVLTANATARRIAEARDGLHFARGRLRATAGADDEALQAAVAEAIAISEQRDAPGGVALGVRRPSGARPYAVVVSPGASAAPGTVFRIASAIVLIGDPDSVLASAEHAVMQVYGLTPSEARLACAVASGETLESYAQARGINVSTARWTMKQALAKTGARRQADLVRMLLTGPVAVARRSGGDA